MRLRRAWTSLVLCSLVAGCAPSRASSSGASAPDSDDPFETDDDFEYEGSLVQEIVECQLWDETCLSRVQDIRHHGATEAKLDRILEQLEEGRKERQRQHEETLRTMKRIAGLDPDAGMGFWCVTSRAGDDSLTECRRSWDECADRILGREREGRTVESRRCTEYAQAACFRLTRSLEEGERALCYGDTATCETARQGLETEGLASPPTACEVTD